MFGSVFQMIIDSTVKRIMRESEDFEHDCTELNCNFYVCDDA